MTNRIILATLVAATTLATGSAFAADLPMRSAPPAPYIAPPLFTWTGFYIGANAGYAFDNVDRLNGTIPGFGTASIPNRSSGFVGGGQAGYNYQFGPGPSGFVIGIEADADYTDLSHTETFGVGVIPLVGNSTVRYRTSLDYLGTIRGRLGYAFNQFLVYGTGGFAYGGVTRNAALLGPAGATVGTLNTSNTETGYAVGGGVEYALPTDSMLNFFHAGAVTIRAEYLHYELGNTTISGSFGNVGGSGRATASGDIARAGINYKF